MPLAVDYLIGNPTNVGFTPNSPVQQQLQNNYAMDFLAIRAVGNLTLAGYTAPPTKLVESLENLFQAIQITATGKASGATTDQLCNVSAAYLRLKTRLLEGTDVTRTDVATANGTYAFETNFKRYFADPSNKTPSLTRLFTGMLSSLMLTYNFRDQTGMVQGGTGGTASLSNVNVTVQARQYLGLTPPSPSPYVKETRRQYNILQSQNGFRCDRAPVGNVLRRQWWKGMVGQNNYSDPADVLFGATGKTEGPHLQLMVNNSRLLLDTTYNLLRQDNKMFYNTEVLPSGYAIYDPSRNRRLASALPMGGVTVADNFVDLNFTAGSVNTIEITDEEVVGLSKDQFANN